MPTIVKERYAAEEILDRLRGIVKADRMNRVGYVTTDQHLGQHREPSAICNGYQACAVGSTLLAGGVKPVRKKQKGMLGALYSNLAIPGAEERNRDALLKRRPELGLAYRALNEAAQAVIDKNGLEETWPRGVHTVFRDPLERLFEGIWVRGRVRPVFFRLIRDAEKRLRAIRAEATT